MVMLSVPGGSLIATVQTKSAPLAGQAAVGSVPVLNKCHARALYAPSVPVVAVPVTVVLLLITNFSDLVAEETYCGRRLPALGVGPGIVILNVASASGPLYGA